MSKKEPSIKLNFGMNALLTLTSIIFPIISFPYVSRVLLPEGTGKVSFAVSLITYFVMLSQLGIPTYGIRACARVRDDREELSRVTHELLFISLIMSLVSYLLLFALIFFIPRLYSEKTLYYITSLMIIFGAIGAEWLYKGLEQYTFITIRSVICKVIALIAMLLLIRERSDYLIYGAITVFAGSAPGLINFICAGRYISFKPVGGYDIKRHLKPVMVFFAMSCATTIYTHLDTVMLGFMTNDTEVGYYNAAVKIKAVLVSLVTSLGAVLLPRASYYIEQGNFSKFVDISRKAFYFVLSVSVPLILYFILFAKESINFISGPAFSGSIAPMQIIMPTLLFIGITNIIGIQMFIPLGKEKVVLLSVIVGAVVDVIVNIILIPGYASAGAAAGTTIAEVAVLIVQVVALRRYFREKNPGFSVMTFLRKLHVLYILPAVLISLAASLWVKRLNLSSFFTLAISSCLFFGIYGIIFWSQWKKIGIKGIEEK